MVVMFMPSAALSRRRECVKVNLHAFFIRISVRGRQIRASDAFASGDVVQGTQWDCKHPGAVDEESPVATPSFFLLLCKLGKEGVI